MSLKGRDSTRSRVHFGHWPEASLQQPKVPHAKRWMQIDASSALCLSHDIQKVKSKTLAWNGLMKFLLLSKPLLKCSNYIHLNSRDTLQAIFNHTTYHQPWQPPTPSHSSSSSTEAGTSPPASPKSKPSSKAKAIQSCVPPSQPTTPPPNATPSPLTNRHRLSPHPTPPLPRRRTRSPPRRPFLRRYSSYGLHLRKFC